MSNEAAEVANKTEQVSVMDILNQHQQQIAQCYKVLEAMKKLMNLVVSEALEVHDNVAGVNPVEGLGTDPVLVRLRNGNMHFVSGVSQDWAITGADTDIVRYIKIKNFDSAF